MNQAFVNHFSYALGDVASTVSQSVRDERVRSSEQALHAAGFLRHYICGKDTTAYDLARRAVEAIRDDLGDIDSILYSTCIPLNGNIGSTDTFRDTRDVKYLMDFPGSHLQSDFQLNNAMVLGLSQQACTSMLGSLHFAKALMAADNGMRRILCVTADRFPERALYEQSYNLISDGAAACVVSTEPAGFRIVAGHAVTNGALAAASDDETVGSFFSYAHRVVHETLAKAGLAMSDIDWIVPQNTNLTAWQIMCKLLSFDYQRVYQPTLSDVGHMISGDNIANLKHMVDNRAVHSGERLLLFMAGYGLNWQCVILEKT